MKFRLWKQDPFGHALWIKRLIIRILGPLTHRRYRGFNHLLIDGSEVIRTLPDKGVLFISNHQTYFADVVAMYHVFNASLRGRVDSLKNINYIWHPKLNLYYVAATETMHAGLLPKILAYVGAVQVSRTWREKGKEIHREVKTEDVENIGIALKDGWLIT
ncbi:MAG: 1-acyl-sn-glycerol-3-phosphate acyltransferase, partial [Capnocytophaga granulosa]